MKMEPRLIWVRGMFKKNYSIDSRLHGQGIYTDYALINFIRLILISLALDRRIRV
jgi:hypothetical protein